MPARTRVLSLVLLAGLAVAYLPSAADAQSSFAVSKGQRLVQKNRKLICFFMHPTVDLKSANYRYTSKGTDGAFTLTYRFRFSGLFGEEYSDQNFHFDRNGRLKRTSNGTSNALVPPGTGAKLFVEFVKDELLRDPDVKDDPILRALINRADARGILEFVLRNADS